MRNDKRNTSGKAQAGIACKICVFCCFLKFPRVFKDSWKLLKTIGNFKKQKTYDFIDYPSLGLPQYKHYLIIAWQFWICLKFPMVFNNF